jgi:hypothetical protein
VIRVRGIGALKAAGVPEAEGAAGEQRQSPFREPGPQDSSGSEQRLRQKRVVRDRLRCVLEIALVRLRDEIREFPHHFSGDTNVFTVRAACEQFHFEALE